MEPLRVVKIGGNVIDDPDKLAAFLKDFASIPGKKILVHGGGKIATRIADTIGYKSKMIEGKRVTDADMLQVATMVYGGLVSKQIVATLQKEGCNALGMTGADAGIIRSVKRPVKEGIDFGYVGDIQNVDSAALRKIIDSGFVPVLAPLTHDGNGQLFNTNADNIASFTAVGLSTDYDTSLYYTFELPGVMADINDPSSVISQIKSDDFQRLKEEKIIDKGMIAKLDASFNAIHSGVHTVTICNAADVKKLLLENHPCGTQLVA